MTENDDFLSAFFGNEVSEERKILHQNLAGIKEVLQQKDTFRVFKVNKNDREKNIKT
mgnify:CR=1 FL=1